MYALRGREGVKTKVCIYCFVTSFYYLKAYKGGDVSENHQILWYLLHGCSSRCYYHYCWARSSILQVLKVTSLQYLYNISKKKLGMEFIFCILINIKASTTWDHCFNGSCWICPKYQK